MLKFTFFVCYPIKGQIRSIFCLLEDVVTLKNFLIITFLLFVVKANAGFVVVPTPPPENSAELDFGREIVAKLSGKKLDFNLASDSIHGFRQKKDSRITMFHTSNDKSGDGYSYQEFNSQISEDEKTQTVLRITGHVYDKSEKPQRGSFRGSIWRFNEGNLVSKTQCVRINYGSFPPLNLSPSTTEYCYTVTPEGCQKFLKESQNLEKMLEDVKACGKLSDKLANITKHLESEESFQRDIAALNKASKGKRALVGFKPGKLIAETVRNEIKTIEAAQNTCSDLMHMWTKSGQIETASDKPGTSPQKAVR